MLTIRTAQTLRLAARFQQKAIDEVAQQIAERLGGQVPAAVLLCLMLAEGARAGTVVREQLLALVPPGVLAEGPLGDMVVSTRLVLDSDPLAIRAFCLSLLRIFELNSQAAIVAEAWS